MTSESKGPRTKMLLVYLGAIDSSELSVAPTYTSSIFVRGPLLSVVIFSFIWTVDLFRSNMLYIFTRFHMALSMSAVLFSHGFVHVFSVRIVLSILTFLIVATILDLLSNSHAAVVNGRAFGFERIRIVIYRQLSSR